MYWDGQSVDTLNLLQLTGLWPLAAMTNHKFHFTTVLLTTYYPGRVLSHKHDTRHSTCQSRDKDKARDASQKTQTCSLTHPTTLKTPSTCHTCTHAQLTSLLWLTTCIAEGAVIYINIIFNLHRYATKVQSRAEPVTAEHRDAAK